MSDLIVDIKLWGKAVGSLSWDESTEQIVGLIDNKLATYCKIIYGIIIKKNNYENDEIIRHFFLKQGRFEKS